MLFKESVAAKRVLVFVVTRVFWGESGVEGCAALKRVGLPRECL